MAPARLLCFAASLAAGVADENCECAPTSGNKASCCAAKNGAGEGTGAFCGSWFSKNLCHKEAPICCTSDGEAQCCEEGSTCSSGCNGGGGGGAGFGHCGCVEPPAPNNVSAQYKEDVAKAYAELTQAAMCGPEQYLVDHWQCEACQTVGFELVPGSMRLINKDAHGIVFKYANTTFAYVAKLRSTEGNGDYGCAVSVRGSKNLVNYVQDALFWEDAPSTLPKDVCDGCKLHSGFMGYWEALEPDVLTSLKALGCTANATDPKNRRVFVTGHSLGAAAATLGMFKLQHYGFDVQQGYVFESPRLGNPAFAEAFAKKFDRDVPVFRVTHQRDPVVHLPPQDGKGVVLPPYQHVKGEVYFLLAKDPLQKAFCGEGENKLCSDRYDLTSCIAHGDDHCNTPLLENGDICNPPPGICGPASIAVV